MEELKNAVEEIANEKIIKAVISNKMNKEVKYNTMIVHFRLNNFTVGYQNRYLCYF